MTANILSLSPYTNKFYDIAFINLREAFTKASTEHIEIELKYAELRYFLNFYNEKDFRDLPPQVKQRIQDLHQFQSQSFLDCLMKISKQNVIYLNPLERSTYYVNAGFNEKFCKKFYHIRSMFKKVCKFNSEVNYRPAPLNGEDPPSIYHSLSLNNENY